MTHFGEFEYDKMKNTLRRQGVPVKIQPQPLKVLAALLGRPGEIVTRDELRASIWGEDTFVEFDQSLNYCIRQIRIALGECPGEPLYLETLPKQGYRFVYPVRIESVPDITIETPVTSPPILESKLPNPNKSKRWIAWAAVAVGVVSLTCIGTLYRNKTQHESEDRSIVVLPFTNHTGRPELDYVADAFTSELIRRIALIPGLKVIGKSSSMTLKGIPINPQEAARKFGVGTVLGGSVLGSSGEIKVEIEATNGRNGRVILNRVYSQGSSRILDMQSTLVQDISESLDHRLGAEDKKRQLSGLTENAQAFDLYLRAQQLSLQFAPPALHESIRLYSEALEKDAKFATALSQLAAAHIYLGLYFEDPRQHMPLAKDLSLRALNIDDTLEDAHGNLGIIALVYDWNYQEAQRQMILASGRLNTSAIQMLACSTHLLGEAGKSGDAEYQIEQVMVTNPLSVGIAAELGCTAYYRRQYQKAIAKYIRALNMKPDDVVGLWGLAKSYGQIGQYQKALEALARSPKPQNIYPPIILGEMGFVEAKMGDRKKALDILDQLAFLRQRTYVDPYFRAQIFHALGETDQALHELEEAFKVKSSILVAIHSDPKWDGLQSNSRFQQLVQRIGF